MYVYFNYQDNVASDITIGRTPPVIQ